MEVYYADQKEMLIGKPSLVHCCDKEGHGKEILYAANGKPVLEVNLNAGQPHGRAKMFDENGLRTFPNTYWYHGQEITARLAATYFSNYEAEEQKIPPQNGKARDKIYETEAFKLTLDMYADLACISKPSLGLLAKRRLEKMR
ncbi:MAG: hypothetical protein ACI4OR_04955 [Alphaproteobacteria bacterium]